LINAKHIDLAELLASGKVFRKNVNSTTGAIYFAGVQTEVNGITVEYFNYLN